MRTPTEQAALSSFIEAAISDDGLGAPHGAAFIPWQATPLTNRVLWLYLGEGRPAILVGAKSLDLLIQPIERGRIGRLRNRLLRRITVEVSYRQKDNAPAADIRPVRLDIDPRPFARPTLAAD